MNAEELQEAERVIAKLPAEMGLKCLFTIDNGESRRFCREETAHTTLRCPEHLAADRETAYSEEYAVASILYYQYDVSMMSDARFDGLCQTLLDAKAYTRIEWLDRESLIAGTGYDVKFPDWLRAYAQIVAEDKA